MAKLGSFLLALVLIGVVAGIFGLRWYVQSTTTAGPLTAEKIIYIAPGTSTTGIAAQLFAENIIHSDLAFRIKAKIENAGSSLKAGEYQFSAAMTMGAVIELLQSGKTFQHQITIPEGLMAFEIVDLLNKEEALTSTIDKIPAEGSLLPETYNYSKGDKRSDIITRMEKSMQATIDEAWASRSPDLPLKSPAEAIILASVVEKETGIAMERPRVAGVFINRLNLRMPLQTDPTVIYAVTEGKFKLDRPIYVKDLKKVSPYNTYLVAGLPPTPIANPGRASIKATLNPEKHDYIYFVADGSGGHVFGKTLAEHNKNVAEWRKIEKQSKTALPPP